MQLMAEEIKPQKRREEKKMKKLTKEENEGNSCFKKATTHQNNLKKTGVKLPSRHYINTTNTS